MERYARQQRLPEVGDTGQSSLARSRPCVKGSGEAARTEEEYLTRAGVTGLERASDETPRPFVHARAFEHAAPRALAAGAWRALCQIRRTLGMDGS
jgi:hypothetical protein